MIIKGTCYFSHIHNQHVIVIISETDENGYALLVPLSSIKFHNNGRDFYNNKPCSFYDHSCVLESSDIISHKNKPVLTKPTFAMYQLASKIYVSDITKYQIDGKLEYRGTVTDYVLKKLQNGAAKTEYIEEHLIKYFSLF